MVQTFSKVPREMMRHKGWNVAAIVPTRNRQAGTEITIVEMMEQDTREDVPFQS